MIYDDRAAGVVLSPHPDDAVLSAWSRLRDPGEVTVVTVCTAAPPAGSVSSWDRLFGVEDSAALVQLRLAEDVAALATAGRSPVSLGFLDGQYRAADLAVEEVTAAVESVVSSAAWLCAPAGIGLHRDHTVVREAALALARAGAIPIALYADLPYAVQFGWPHWVTGREPFPYLVPEAKWEAELAGASVRWDQLVPRVVALDDGEVTLKGAALREYRTQFAALNSGPLGRIEHPDVISFELFWDVV